jgi:pimeloyl-ACP methyl ester carboxylesterase
MIGAFAPRADWAARSDPEVVGQALHELALADLGPRLAAITAPTTILYASPDPQLRATLDRRWSAAWRTLRGARLTRIDDSGHLIMADQPARFVSELRTFLKSP